MNNKNKQTYTQKVLKGDKMGEKEIYQKLIEKYGIDSQLTICIEEMSELQKEICKLKRIREGFNKGHLSDIQNLKNELVHVEISLSILKQIGDLSKSELKEIKEERLKIMENILYG